MTATQDQAPIERLRGSIRGLGHARPKNAAQQLLKLIGESDEGVAALAEIVAELHQQSDHIGHLMVDANHRESRALALSRNCEAHGRELAEMDRWVHLSSEREHRADAARLRLLSVLFRLQNTLEGLRGRLASGNTLPDGQVVEVLTDYLGKASRSYDRAWHPSPTRRTRAKG